MSCDYAEALSHYDNKGKLGGPELIDSIEDVKEKVLKLSVWMKDSTHTVIHTGAGISTSAGIPDFRGPKGVWTLENQGKKPVFNTSWDDAKPTLTHMALVSLEKAGLVQYIVSQNIDGLHLKSGFPRKKLAELHGNMFVDKCNNCNRLIVKHTASRTLCRKSEDVPCPAKKHNGRKCRGRLFDTILDWEDGLPENDLQLSEMHSCAADLSLCLGTTLQINPSGKLPIDTKRRGGKVIICNLQATKQDRNADLIIHGYVDDIMKQLLSVLKIDLLTYSKANDPTFITHKSLENVMFNFDQTPNSKLKWPEKFLPIDWSLEDDWLKDQTLISSVATKNNYRKLLLQKQRKKQPVTECVDLKLTTECSMQFGTETKKKVKLEE